VALEVFLQRLAQCVHPDPRDEDTQDDDEAGERGGSDTIDMITGTATATEVTPISRRFLPFTSVLLRVVA
jgi:hypothetical protein